MFQQAQWASHVLIHWAEQPIRVSLTDELCHRCNELNHPKSCQQQSTSANRAGHRNNICWATLSKKKRWNNVTTFSSLGWFQTFWKTVLRWRKCTQLLDLKDINNIVCCVTLILNRSCVYNLQFRLVKDRGFGKIQKNQIQISSFSSALIVVNIQQRP